MNTVPTTWSRRLGLLSASAIVVSLLYFFAPATAAACGSIIGSEDEWLGGVSFGVQPISDCANPFAVTDTGVRGRLLVQGSEVGDGGSAVVSADGTSDVRFEYRPSGDELYNIATWQLFRRDNDDYRYTPVFSRPLTLAEYREAAVAFLPAGSDVDRFITAYEQNDTTVFGDDPDLLARYDDLLDYFDTLPKKQPDTILPGSYVLVVRERYLTVSRRNPVWEFFVPTAHAQGVIPDRVTTLHFTLVEETSAPIGASSVLFLPGIQASRLYKGGLLGIEDQVWPPNSLFNNDVRALAMTNSGLSVNTIYTRDVIDSSVAIGSVYGGFLEFLEMQKMAPTLPIKEYLAFAYDWRFSVQDIVFSGTQYDTELKAVIDELEDLAQGSYTGQVTVIAHSNGGLLAKAMLRELELRNQQALVDKVVFVGVPHLGTPKAIGTVLHGYDQTDKLGGIIIDAKTVREVVNTMLGVYGLLPSAEYFKHVSGPVVTFESGSATDPYRARYGDRLDTFATYRDFMIGADGFDRGLDTMVSNPVRAQARLFDQMLDQHVALQDNWVAPSSTTVVEVVGIGLPTVSSLHYRNLPIRDCQPVGSGRVICRDGSRLKPFANLSRLGDGTVMVASASGYAGPKQLYYVNLPVLNVDQRLQGRSAIEHYNLTEAEAVQAMLLQVLHGQTPTANEIVTTTPPPPVMDGFTIEVIDSPVRPVVTDAQGRVTGSEQRSGAVVVRAEIPGSQYFELGETKYVVMPTGVTRTTTLRGEGWGDYSLRVYDWTEAGGAVLRAGIINAPVTPMLRASYTVADNQYGAIRSDDDGNGVTDRETALVPLPEATVVKSGGSSSLRRVTATALVAHATTTVPVPVRYQLVHALTELVAVYKQQGSIDPTVATQLVTILGSIRP